MGTKPNPDLFFFSHSLEKAGKIPASCPNLPQLRPGTSLKSHLWPPTRPPTHRGQQVQSPRCQLCPRGHPRATGLSRLLAPCLRASPPPPGATAEPGLQSRGPASPRSVKTAASVLVTSGRRPRPGSGGEHPRVLHACHGPYSQLARGSSDGTHAPTRGALTPGPLPPSKSRGSPQARCTASTGLLLHLRQAFPCGETTGKPGPPLASPGGLP